MFAGKVELIKTKGFDKKNYILIDDKKHILDGNHRGAWLLSEFGPEHDVDVVQIYTLHEDKKWDLFPFEKVKKGSSLLIYGASEVGESYVDQMSYTQYAKVKGIIDQKPEKWNGKPYLREKAFCISSQNLKQEFFNEIDFVVLATRNDQNARHMKAILRVYVDDKCIISRCVE